MSEINMNDKDWAETIAKTIVYLVANVANRDDIKSVQEKQVQQITLALKQTREIGRLEANRAPKCPTEIPDDKFIDVRDERGELVRFVELDWFKQSIGALSE